MAVPTNAPSRRVKGTLIRGVFDDRRTPVAGLPLRGAKVIATARIRTAQSAQFIVLDPVVGYTDNDAVLRSADTGEPGLVLLVTDSPAVGIIDWTWHFEITAPSLDGSIEFDMPVPTGTGDIDLSGLDPIPNSDGELVFVWREALADEIASGVAPAIQNEIVARDLIAGSDYRLPKKPGRLVRDEFVTQDKYAHPTVTEDGAVPGGWHLDGSYEFEVAPRWPGSGGSGGSAEGQTFSSRWTKVGIGDSLVEGYSSGAYWPAADSFIAKAALADTRATYVNLGMSGATVDEVCIQAGALPLVSQAQVVVPASGTVGVTVQAGIGWRPDRTWSFHGKLGTVAGTITRTTTATTALTFVPDSGQGGVTLPIGAQFVSDNVIHRDAIPIILMGRNNVSYNVKGTHATIVDHVLAGYARLIAWLDAQNKRFLVCGTINQTNELSGSANYVIVKAINDYLAATYPLNWVNVRAYLVTQAIKDQGITPTTADNTAMAGDAPPPSVMDDPTHYSKASAVGIGALTSTAIMRRDWRA